MSDDITQANAEVSAKDSTPRLQVNHLSVAFHTDEGRVPAVSDVSFSIAPGRITALLGESGSGKSVTSLALMRLLPGSTHQTGSRQTVTGSARFVARDGRAVDLLSLPEARMRALRGNQIAMVFQEPMSCPNPVFTVGKHLKRYFGDAKRPVRALRSKLQIIFQDPYASLNPKMRIKHILGEALATHGLAQGPGEAPRRIAELLELVGLRAEQAERYPHEFSGGQRQRIGVARALAVEPEFIGADEPLSALDVSIQAQVLNLLCELRERLHLTMLFISHDLDVVAYLCDRVVVLYLGRVMELAPTAALFEAPLHPYTLALLAASLRPDPTAPLQQVVLQGDIPSPIDPPSGCVFRTRCPQAQAACAATIPALEERAPSRWVACLRKDLA